MSTTHKHTVKQYTTWHVHMSNVPCCAHDMHPVLRTVALLLLSDWRHLDQLGDIWSTEKPGMSPEFSFLICSAVLQDTNVKQKYVWKITRLEFWSGSRVFWRPGCLHTCTVHTVIIGSVSLVPYNFYIARNKLSLHLIISRKRTVPNLCTANENNTARPVTLRFMSYRE